MDDWDVFFDPSDFGVSAIWETQAAETVNLNGIFEKSREAALTGDSIGISALHPVFTVASDQIPQQRPRVLPL